jgi:23S rRNA pseudouridine955/2504/2580 synthase
MMRLQAGPNDQGRRIDRIVRKACAELPVSAIYRLLRKGLVLLDGKRAKPESRVASGQIIEVRGIDALDAPPSPVNSGKAERIAGDFAVGREIAVLYEGEGILALNKPCGIDAQQELCGLVRVYLEGKLPPSLSFLPGPLHRLDKGASGVIIFGKSLEGARKFSEIMSGGLLQKTYMALLEGRLDAPQVWRDKLAYSSVFRRALITDSAGSKYAETRAAPLEVFGGLTVAKINIVTGRKHQIRAQAAARGYPLYGDGKYGGKNRPPFFLHACRLDFPEDASFPRSISAPVPADFEQKLLKLGFSCEYLEGVLG